MFTAGLEGFLCVKNDGKAAPTATRNTRILLAYGNRTDKFIKHGTVTVATRKLEQDHGETAHKSETVTVETLEQGLPDAQHGCCSIS